MIKMKSPKMILFDFGQTIADIDFDPIAGINTVLAAATKNPYHTTAEQIQKLVMELNVDIGKNLADPKKDLTIEVHNYPFTRYLYEYLDIGFDISPLESNEIFRKASSKTVVTPGFLELMKVLKDRSIRMAVLSNITYSGEVLRNWIAELLPIEMFEFIIASSEYVFRKPHKRIFEIALRKAGLDAADVWHAGDSAIYDVDGAAACGIFPVWYKGASKSFHYTPKSECLEIMNWDELIKLL